jgi:outer membrane biosynthesis protein TonB
VATELGGAQISSLLETLPGIAQVLRSPVADAFSALIRQASRHQDFTIESAEEVLRYSVRRNLMSQDESDQILAELREGAQRKAERAADRAEARKPAVKAGGAAPRKPAAKPKPKAAAKPKAAKPAPKPKAPARPARAAAKKKAPARKR